MPLGFTTPTAALPPSADIDQELAQLNGEIEHLRTTLNQALERRTEALSQVAGSTTTSIQAQTQADTAERQARHTNADQARSGRALYRTGGKPAILSTVLSAQSWDDVAQRRVLAFKILQVSDQRATKAEQAARERRTVAEEAATMAATSTATFASVSQATNDAQQALSKAQARYSSLSEQARASKQAEQAAAALLAAQGALTAAETGPVPRGKAQPLPPAWKAMYQQATAARCPGMAWTLLAAVGQVESGHGRNNGPSSAGARGPMQFMPGTWAQYGVDANGDGVANVMDPVDATHSAARYLCASGAGSGPAGAQKALFAYNRSQAYVQLVLSVQASLVSTGQAS